jgi:hypothetical protein
MAKKWRANKSLVVGEYRSAIFLPLDFFATNFLPLSPVQTFVHCNFPAEPELRQNNEGRTMVDRTAELLGMPGRPLFCPHRSAIPGNQLASTDLPS